MTILESYNRQVSKCSPLTVGQIEALSKAGRSYIDGTIAKEGDKPFYCLYVDPTLHTQILSENASSYEDCLKSPEQFIALTLNLVMLRESNLEYYELYRGSDSEIPMITDKVQQN